VTLVRVIGKRLTKSDGMNASRERGGKSKWRGEEKGKGAYTQTYIIIAAVTM
jgi:hypothetical protein